MRMLYIAAGLAFAASATSVAQAATDCRIEAGITPADAAETLCHFDRRLHRFAGSPVDQATCLTRHVSRGAQIGEPEIPPGLAALVGKPVGITPQRLRIYLDEQHLGSEQLGGGLGSALPATYFIIHDTSFPNCSEADQTKSACPVFDQFPAGRDLAGWAINTSFGGRPRAKPNREANVYVNRVGASVTEADFADRTLGTTKFEYCQLGEANLGDFVGVENIQPRLSAERRPFKPLTPGKHRNDSLAPEPGFTDPQYERLALLYVVASVRHGSWMIPAYHAVIDHYFRDKHDDPQNFDANRLDRAVQQHLRHLQ